MKQKIKLILILLVAMFAGATSVHAASDDIVYFPDETLEKALLKYDTNDDMQLQISEMEAITKLNLSGLGIRNIEGLQYAINLKELFLNSVFTFDETGEQANYYNYIKDISPLASLTKLTTLDLSGIKSLKDISIISNLTNLRNLNLARNNIIDITVLAKLTKLTNLNLYENDIVDITSLGKLTKLTDLNLARNDVNDITALGKLIKLINLNLEGNDVNDVTALGKLTNLTNLNLEGNNVNDITALGKLINLTNLNLDGNNVSDVTALGKLTKLTDLNLDGNNVSDVTTLAKLTKLINLDLSRNSVSNITALARLTKLTSLSLYENRITNVVPLSSLGKLSFLNLRRNFIEDFSSVANVENKLVDDQLSETDITKLYIYDISYSYQYSGSEIKPDFKIENNYDVRLKEDIDYTVNYNNNKNVGAATITITGKGIYTGTITKRFKIKAKDISEIKVTGIEDKAYTGKSLTQKVVVKDGKTTLKKDKDYIVSYKNNKKLGTATITIKGKGNYKGTITKKFKIIIPKVTSLKTKTQTTSSITINWKKDKNVTGYAIYRATSKNGKYTKVATITKNGTTTYTDKDLSTGKTYYYKIKAYKIIDKAKKYGSYSSILTTTTRSVKENITKLSAGSKKATITWKKDSKATGYEIYRATSKNGKYTKMITITKNSTTIYTDKKLTKNKTYYYKVRAYKTIGKEKVKGPFSSIKSVKVK